MGHFVKSNHPFGKESYKTARFKGRTPKFIYSKVVSIEFYCGFHKLFSNETYRFIVG